MLTYHARPRTAGVSVKFQIPSPSGMSPPAVIKKTSHKHHTLEASKIQDLCKSLIVKGSQSSCIGFLEDQSQRHHLFLVSGPGAEDQIKAEESLHHLLLQARSMTLGPREK